MNPSEVYRNYLAFKNHFTKDKYDYFKYGGRSRASESAFNKRKDRYFFERMSRKKSDDEIKEFFLANFSQASDSNQVWIGPIIDGGEKVYKQWVEHKQNLFETFKNNSECMMDTYNYDEFFDCKKGHPPILREYLGGKLSIEELIIYDIIFSYVKNYDKKLLDPVWETVSLKIKKYSPFLNIGISKYKNYLTQRVKERYHQ